MKNGFLRELHKRRVTRVALAYVVIAWLVLQVADVVVPALGLPDWAITLVLVLLVAGFPLALVLSWLFDIGPEGIERTEDTAPDSDQPPETATPARSIVVLPFPDLSAEQDQGYFCDGLTDELIGRLARVDGLRVASRSSSFAFKDRNEDLQSTAQKLQVAHVLEGGVRKDGNRVRISAQLTEAAGDTVLWAENYDRELCDIFTIQEDIAGRILEALRLQLGTAGPATPGTADSKAYEYYLRGRGYAVYNTKKDLELARSMFEKATQVDPEFLEAWAGLAEVTALSSIFFTAGGEKERQASDRAGRRALELAPEQGIAQMAFAFGQLACDCYEDAEAAFLKAVEFDPSLHKSWHYLGRIAHHAGKLEQEIEYFNRAISEDPEDWVSPILVLSPMRHAREKDEVEAMARLAVDRVKQHLEYYPDNQRAYYLGLGALFELGEMQQAREWAETALRLAPDDQATLYNLACFHAQAGEIDTALDLLEKSIFSRSWIENDHDLDNLRGHPRFERYLDSLQNTH